MRRTLIGVGALAAAAVLASVLTIVVPQALAPKNTIDVVAIFTAAAGQTVPIDMEVDLTRKDWGTQLSVTCLYRSGPANSASYGPSEYSLWVAWGGRF